MAKHKVKALHSHAVLNIDSMIANENIVQSELKQEIELSMLSYSVLTIVDRALPDARDGLKPAQRRILYCCKENGYDYNKRFIKSAKIAGDVTGNYHPHGSCYGTVVNMSQPWRFRYPLIDFHGNNGSIDGDGPAADRYTEGRLSKISSTMILEDVIDKHCVDFKQNYSETALEPKVLPGLLPNLFLNGADGIAVGYTTAIPSHNLNELCDGIIYAIQNDDYDVHSLMKYVKGPDFPYGSKMLEEGIEELYNTGIGKLTFRANYILEENHESKNQQIVFVDLPPDSAKPKLLEKIYSLIVTKALPRVIGVRDESKGMDIRIVIECQKTCNIPEVINILYSSTNLQKTKSFIIRAIIEQVPKLLSLKDYVDVYLEHRKSVIYKRMKSLADDYRHKIEIQEGLSKVINHIKTVLNMIIDCETQEEAKNKLMDKYHLSSLQADYILDRKTRSLVRMDRNKINELLQQLKDNLAYCELILNDENELKKHMIKQLEDMKKEFGDKRRTEIVKEFSDYVDNSQDNNVILKDVVAVLCTNNEIKLYSTDDFQKFIDKKQFKDKHSLFKQCLRCHIDDDIIVINKTGECNRISVVDLQYSATKFNNAINIIKYDENDKHSLLIVMKNGNVKKTIISKIKFKKNKTLTLIKDNTSEIAIIRIINDSEDEIINIATNKGFLGRFSCNSFTSTLFGPKTLPSSKIDDDDFIVDCYVTLKKDENDLNVAFISSMNDESLHYKVMKLNSILVKGRTARALSYVHDKKFSSLQKIIIFDNDFEYLNADNKKKVMKKYEIKNRNDKSIAFDDTIHNVTLSI